MPVSTGGPSLAAAPFKSNLPSITAQRCRKARSNGLFGSLNAQALDVQMDPGDEVRSPAHSSTSTVVLRAHPLAPQQHDESPRFEACCGDHGLSYPDYHAESPRFVVL
jgi:hypothetical protein